MPEPQKRPRRKYIVNPSFQWYYLRMILGIEAMVFCVTLMLTLSFYQLILGPALAASGSFWAMLGSFLALFVVCSAYLIYLGLQTSNRISGPIHRINQILQEIAADNIPESVRFRDGDFHPELAQHMNEALGALRDRDRASPEGFKRQLENLQRLSGELIPEITKALEDLAEACTSASSPDQESPRIPR